MNQRERLGYLVKAFIDDDPKYKSIDPHVSEDRQKILLRSMMNVRMPAEMDSQTLRIQDEYLKQRAIDSGIVDLNELKTIREEGSSIAAGEYISLWQGDITRLKVDAIVNAANNQMLGCFIPMHTCIDNCIHSYAGIQLRNECAVKMRQLREIHGDDYVQPTGVPLLTKGYNLPAEHVIHVVGPVVYGKLHEKEKRELSDCYINVLNMCRDNGLKSVAFCCISTGVFHFPNETAAHIAVDTVCRWLDENPNEMERVIFNVFKDEDKEYYRKQLLQ